MPNTTWKPVTNAIKRQTIEIPCAKCGTTMTGEADVAIRALELEYHTAKAGEIIRFHWMACGKCGAMPTPQHA